MRCKAEQSAVDGEVHKLQRQRR